MNTRIILSAVLGSALAVSAAVAAPEDQSGNQKNAQTQVAAAEKIDATTTIVKIDAQKRDLTLRDDEGNQFTVHVPNNVSRFGALKPGDQVHLRYYASIATALEPPKAGEQPNAGQIVFGAPIKGKLPGDFATRSMSATVDVVAVDAANHKLTVKLPDGTTDTIDVTDPALQPQLAQLKAGDRVHATFTQAVALTVTQAKNKAG